MHFITRHKISPAEDLKSVIETLYRGGDEPEQENEVSRPNILWSLHFSMNEYEVGSDILPPNVFSSPGPNASMDFDEYVIEVRIQFQYIFSYCALDYFLFNFTGQANLHRNFSQ